MNVFDRLFWSGERMHLDDLVFQMEHGLPAPSPEAREYFMLYKTRGLIEQYAKFWRRTPNFRASNIVEFGIWDGGSSVLWYEQFNPEKYVAIDYANWGESTPFSQYRTRRKLNSCLKTYWGVSQADRALVRAIIAEEFTSPLDLVIDDATHQYHETKVSFETLFPLLSPGGMYIIEDWAWGLWKGSDEPHEAWDVVVANNGQVVPSAYRNRTPLRVLIHEIIETTGATWLVEQTTVCQGFVVVERSDVAIIDPSSFTTTKTSF